MLRIGILVSGGGTNLQALIDAQKNGEIIGGEIKLVVSSNKDAYALERAANEGIKTSVLHRKDFSNSDEFDASLLHELTNNKIDVVVLAGFLCILGSKVLSAYSNKIINVHPSLIPSFCGDGFYGLKVHKAALDYGVKVTGATVHFVNEVVDGGKIIMQKAVEVKNDDTPETLQKRVMTQAEWDILPKAVSLYCQGKVDENGKISR